MYLYSHHGALDFRIVQCRLSILRNDNVPCRYFSNVPVDFKVVQCSLSNLRKRCLLVDLKGQGPHHVSSISLSTIIICAYLSACLSH